MLRSEVVDVHGTFVGAAFVRLGDERVVFVATHDSARPIDGRHFASVRLAREEAARSWHAHQGAQSSISRER